VSAASNPSNSADREIVITRVLDAPVQVVWQAFTDPKRIPQWWGPSGFRTTTKKMEVKPGGVWRFVMHGPDGHDYENLITYLEVVEPRRLRYKHGGDKDAEPVNFEVTVTFEQEADDDQRTLLTMRSVFPSSKARDFIIREYNALEGAKQNVGRLAEYLRTITGAGVAGVVASDRPFVISRVYQVPRDVLWSMWTEPEHLKSWFGPKDVSIASCKLDLRPGGTFHYGMQTPGGPVMWGKWVFREVVPRERLAFISSFSDANAGLKRHPMSANWPLETLSTVTLAEHAGISRGTTLVVRWIPINATAIERRTFDESHASMQQGWTGTLDRLNAYLTEAHAEP
jgi:uncharacterized protein YndB with AHSA1/START domain